MNTYFTKELLTPQALSFYRSQFREMIWIEKAHGMMLVKQELLEPDLYRIIAEGLDRVEETLKEEAVSGENGDLYSNITGRLYDIVGEKTGCLIHLGRSRNDMEWACNRMQVRRNLLHLMEQMNELMALLLDKAEEHRNTIITYYTYGQPAQPGTFGHYLLLLFQLFSRDWVRLQAAYHNTNQSPMGAAAGIGSSYPLDLEYTARLLGFERVIEHSMDAISSADFLLETEAAIAVIMSNISKTAQDLLFWASYEYRLLDCDSSITGESSIMPQKKNPECIEQMRAQSGMVLGRFAGAMALSRNTTLFPNTESVISLFYDFEPWMREAERALGLLREVLLNSKIRLEASYAYTSNNFTTATAMAESLSQSCRIPFTQAHHMINRMIRRLTADGHMEVKYLTGELMAEVSADILGQSVTMTDEQVQKLADPAFCLNTRTTGGTPRREDMTYLIGEGRHRLEELQQWRNKQQNCVERAYREVKSGR